MERLVVQQELPEIVAGHYREYQALMPPEERCECVHCDNSRNLVRWVWRHGLITSTTEAVPEATVLGVAQWKVQCVMA